MIGRAEYMLSIAVDSLKATELPSNPGFKLSIQREPLGVVFIVAPWNFPYLVSINSVLPAIIAGNSVLLKPSPQTPLVAERMQRALELAGFPTDVMQSVHLGQPGVEHVAKHSLVNFVSFTGSVAKGRWIEKVTVDGENIKGVALEVSQLSSCCRCRLISSSLARWERSCICSPRCRFRLHSSRTRRW